MLTARVQRRVGQMFRFGGASRAAASQDAGRTCDGRSVPRRPEWKAGAFAWRWVVSHPTAPVGPSSKALRHENARTAAGTVRLPSAARGAKGEGSPFGAGGGRQPGVVDSNESPREGLTAKDRHRAVAAGNGSLPVLPPHGLLARREVQRSGDGRRRNSAIRLESSHGSGPSACNARGKDSRLSRIVNAPSAQGSARGAMADAACAAAVVIAPDFSAERYRRRVATRLRRDSPIHIKFPTPRRNAGPAGRTRCEPVHYWIARPRFATPFQSNSLP